MSKELCEVVGVADYDTDVNLHALGSAIDRLQSTIDKYTKRMSYVNSAYECPECGDRTTIDEIDHLVGAIDDIEYFASVLGDVQSLIDSYETLDDIREQWKRETECRLSKEEQQERDELVVYNRLKNR